MTSSRLIPGRGSLAGRAAPLLFGILAGVVAAQEGLRPLDHPRAPLALRGMVVVVDPLPEGDQAVALRAAHYLARIFERAGAGVALTRTGTGSAPREVAAELAERAGAHLVVRMSGESAPDDVAPVAVRSPVGQRPSAALGGTLADRLTATFGDCERTPGEVGAVRPIVEVRVLSVSPGEDAVAERRHRPAVHALFEAVVAWGREERKQLAELPPARGGGRAADPSPRGRPFWPIDRPPETEAEVAGLIEGWHRGLAMDRTQIWLEVEVRRTGDEWVLSGSTELPALERAVKRMLVRCGVKPLRGALRPLPSPALGADPFGIATDHAALTWADPGSHTGLRSIDGGGQVEQTELRVREPVRLLDARNGYLLVHALSGYLGWVPEPAVRACTEAEHRAAVDAATGPSERGVLVAEWAVRNLGVPYVFGGRSSTGFDCSGLCQASWSEQGVFLPRDARMQVLTGALVSTRARPAPLRAGDLLFFANGAGRISHIGLSLGGDRFVHATLPQVTVGSLDPADPWYDRAAERFVLAKRPAR